jgi:hypothetical protein
MCLYQMSPFSDSPAQIQRAKQDGYQLRSGIGPDGEPDSQGLAFKIEFPNHTVGEIEYQENIRAFVEQCNIAVPSVGGLRLDSSPSTASPTLQPQTPSKIPGYFDDGEIGQGEFGLVRKLIDLREGTFFAVKNVQLTSSHAAEWQKEAVG